ncbi:RidA family protein [Candidatus Enterococcus ferrettii]|uniref:2-iminobutanoate/2-iminopropanoate deaminase n=1 Tax=Candidatus Enterococcus ferrettii TaxID=2815324 RepID=A0ABV0EW20_9ENTE|nr:RidA family protein [Enterococcus sp. 665A]MBO1339950.1 RidA family protein [Enterococcus sp. 665A]
MQRLNSDQAPKALGPYSQGMVTGNTVFLSGQLGIDPATNQLKESVEEQAKQSLANIKNVLSTIDLSLKNVVKVTVFLKDLDHFAAVNEIYANHFEEPYPARSCVQVAKLPADALVEIEVIAEKV